MSEFENPPLRVLVSELDITLGSMVALLIKFYIAFIFVTTIFVSLFLVFGFMLFLVLALVGAAVGGS